MTVPTTSASDAVPQTLADRTPVTRRSALYAGVAAAAGAAGAGLAWWRLRPAPAQDGAQQAVWTQAFDTPDGARLDMAGFAGRPLILNFWATWCPPCVEELPMLNTFYRENRSNGWQVVGLAIDQPSSVRKFLTRLPLEFPVGLAGLGGSELGRSLGNLAGGLPFTVVFGAKGQVLHRKMGQVTSDDLQRWLALR